MHLHFSQQLAMFLYVLSVAASFIYGLFLFINEDKYNVVPGLLPVLLMLTCTIPIWNSVDFIVALVYVGHKIDEAQTKELFYLRLLETPQDYLPHERKQ